jgi:low temperature requirement protein LtrA
MKNHVIAPERAIRWKPEAFVPDRPVRKVSWLELFHDLVYAATISQVTHGLTHGDPLHHLGTFLLVFTLVIWSWMNGAYYYDLHGNDYLWTRAFTLVQMLATVALAVTVSGVFEGHHQPFAVAFCCMQALITFLWMTTGWFDRDHKPLSVPHSATYAVALCCLIASVFVPFTWAMLLWGLALSLDFGVELIIYGRFERIMAQKKWTFKPSASIVERFGLFTMIVLGESVFGIVNGMMAGDLATPRNWFLLVTCMCMAFLLWWLYFELLGDRRTKPGFRNYVWLNLVHLPSFAAFALVGPCMALLITDKSTECGPVHVLFSVAVAIALVSIVGLSLILAKENATEERARVSSNKWIIFVALLVLATPFALRSLGTSIFLLTQVSLLLGLVVQGTLSGAYEKLLERVPER